MEMDDDDEFGGLYTDILHPTVLRPPPSPPHPDLLAGGDRISLRNPKSNLETLAPTQIRAAPLIQEPNDDWVPDNWNDDDDGFPSAVFPELVQKPTIRVPVEGCGIGGDLDQQPVIPGLSSSPIPIPNGIATAGNIGNTRISNSEDLDSDSDDDLQIVLNESSHHWHPMMMMEDDEDAEEDLVIVTDGDQQLLHHPSMEEQVWGEGEMPMAQTAAEGERREGMDLARANGPVVGAAAHVIGQKVGYSGPPYQQQQHHSMYKYIRPGAPVIGSVGPPGQIRPPPPLGPIAGRGRGDWRPPGIRGISNPQKSFHSGIAPWVSTSSGRAIGGGLDFTLPSHKTIFDVDIGSFEEKPWRHPGVDISDYFNFRLDEDNWKDYCKQLDHHRFASTMQGKIRVYESGRSEQNYDPDLPPELAAAAGHHDISAHNLQYGKMDNGQVDLSAQGRVIPCIRPPLPTGRPIQVESGSGERLPSIDTRPPRTRDSDAIIEIVLQDRMDDSTKYNSTNAEKDIRGEQLQCDRDAEEGRHSEQEYFDQFSLQEMGNRRIPSAPEGDGILPFPPELPFQYHHNYKTRSPLNAGGSFSTRHGGRLGQGTSRGRCSSASGDNSNDVIGSRRAQVIKHDIHHRERPGDSMKGNQIPEISPDVAVETARELSIEQKDDRLALSESVDAEGEETSDFRVSCETLGDDSILHSRNQKLSSQVEPVIQDNGDAGDLRATHSDSSRAKSGSSKEYQKRHDNGEVVQDGRLRRASDMTRRQEVDHIIRRKDDYGRESRHDMDKTRMTSKGREAMYHSYPYREWESNSAHSARGKSVGFERPRESDILFRQRRDDDIHRRVKDDDIRRDHIEETGSRDRSKIRVIDRNDKDDGIHTKRRVDDGGRHRGVPRQRERDDLLMNRRENLDDQVKRKKDDDHLRRERIDKEVSLPGYRVRQDSSHQKRERDDVADHRRREEISRIRDKPDDYHSSKQKDEICHQREREDRQRLKQPHEDSSTHQEREEGRGATKSRRLTEDKPLSGNGRSKTDSKGIGSDKDYPHRDKRRQAELSKKGDHVGGENNPLHKGRDDVYAREKRYNMEEMIPRHERLSTHNDRSTIAYDNQHISRERPREGTMKSRDTEGSGKHPRVLGKRKHEDHISQQNEKVSSKGPNEQENLNASVSKKGSILALSSEIHVDDIASDDENQQDARRGRSKLERWTSHKERDYIAPNMHPPLSSIAAAVDSTDNEILPIGELPKIGGNETSDPDGKGAEEGQITDNLGDDPHLDTVAKLKKRSERFKLPMPGDKKPENESQPTQTEGAIDTEVKPERPARKRRWISS